MNIYTASSTKEIQKNRKLYKTFLNIINSFGHRVQDSWFIQEVNNTANKISIAELVLKNTRMLQEADLMIIEARSTSFGVGYLFGQALANRKPVLVLEPEEIDDDQISDVIKGATSSLVTRKKYNLSNLESVLKEYFDSLDFDNLRKFNFITSKEVMDFIDKGASQEGKSKSEFLRDLISNTFLK